jgi:hypothetical protein
MTACDDPLHGNVLVVIRRTWILLVVVAGSALLAAPGRSDPRPAAAAVRCSDVRHGIPRADKIVGSGTRVRVATGAVVFVALVEFEFDYDGHRYPSAFPWLAASSSNTAVLRPVPICPIRGAVSTLPVRDAAFRAAHRGAATLTAPLATAWKHAPRNPFRPYRADVLVTGAAS